MSHTAAIRSGWHGAGHGCGNEASADVTVGEVIGEDEEAEHGWCCLALAMEVEEPALEAGVGHEATPTLADEARWTVGREPEQDLFHELVHQWWRRPRRRRRRHDSSLPQIATCRAFRLSASAYLRPLLVRVWLDRFVYSRKKKTKRGLATQLYICLYLYTTASLTNSTFCCKIETLILHEFTYLLLSLSQIISHSIILKS